MASNYVKLVEARRMAMRRGKTDEAETLFVKIRELVRSGKVTEEEFTAGMYI